MREVIPEAEDALERVQLVGDRLAAVYLHDAHHRLSLFELDGRHVMDVALPGIGKVVDMAGRRIDDDLFLTWIDVHRAGDGPRRSRWPTAPSARSARPTLGWDPDAFVTEQVFVEL